MNKSLVPVVVVSVLALAAITVWWSQQPRVYVFDVRVWGLDESRKASILVDGSEITSSSGTTDISFTVAGGRAREYSDVLLPKMGVRYLNPCGWKDVEVDIRKPDDVEVKAASRERRNIVVSVHVPDEDRRRVLVDNRDQPERLLKIGGSEVRVPADQSYYPWFVLDTRCPEGQQVVIDGRLVASVPPHPPGEKDSSRYFLLDPTGKRCYGYRVASYYPKDLPPQFYRDTVDRTVYLPVAFLNQLPGPVDDFFRTPETVFVPGAGGQVTHRRSLLDAHCSNVPQRAER